MDRDAIARKVRRRQVQEALDFEREREQTITEQIEMVVVEADGGALDAEVFARMSAEDVEIVRDELSPPVFDSEDGPTYVERDDLFDFEEEVDPHAEELARLNGELEQCRRRQKAFESYIAALGG